MTIKMDERILRKIFSEIVASYSLAKLSNDTIFIKHFSSIDLLEFDFAYQNYFNYARERGIPTEEERIKLLKRDKLWEDSQDKLIEELKDYLSGLYDSKRNQYALKEIGATNVRIKETSDKLNDILNDKYNLIGECAETFARRKTDLDQVFGSFYKDNRFLSPVFKEEDKESLSDEELSALISVYNKQNAELSDANIRKVSVSSDFQTMFSMTEDLYHFYGSPIAKLTHLQIRLANLGSYFKSILTSGQKVPNDILGNPDAIEDWFFARTNIQKVLEKDQTEGKSVSMVGMTRKELEYLGVEIESPKKSIKQAALESGGEINMNQMIAWGGL